MLPDTENTAKFPGSDPLAPVVSASPVLEPPTQGGLSLTQLENMLSDLRFQPQWRNEANRAADYYDGHQIEAERLARMDRLGIPPLVTNLIRPTIDAVLGLEAKTRTDWRVIEEDYAAPVPEPVLNALNQKLSEAERESRADRAMSDAHASQIKTGIGWVEVARSTDAMAYPYRVNMVHRDEIYWDWNAKQPDLTDARYMIRKRRFDEDELIALMPEHEELIKNAIGDRFRTWQWDTKDMYSPTLAYAAEVERIANLDDDWRDAERHRATLFEVWYRKWVRGLVMKLPNGKIVPFNESDPRHVAAVQAGIIRPYQATYSQMRVAFYLGPHQLYDFKSPYAHRFYPYVPFWGFREDKSGVPYGLVRGMMSPQDVVNSADAKMHWMLNARRLIASSDAIDARHNSWRQVQDELARPDAVVLLDPAKPTSTFKVEQDFQLTAQQYSRRLQAANDIENAGGVFKSMMGKEGGATSGIAINALIEQGSVTLAEINDNYRFARRQVGEMLFSMIHEDLIGQPMTVQVPAQFGSRKKPVALNTPNPMTGTVDNNVALVNAKVVLNDVPSTPAFRAQQLQVLSEVVKSLPPEMQMATIDVLIKLTDVPEKELLIERLRRMAGIQDIPPEMEDQMMAQQQAAAAEAAGIQKAGALAAIEKTTAETEALKAKTQATMAEIERAAAELEATLGAQGNAADPLVEQMQRQLNDVLQEAIQVQDQMAAEAEKAAAAHADEVMALNNKLMMMQQDRSIEKYQVDTTAETERMRIRTESDARQAEIAAGQSTAQDVASKALSELSKQVETLRAEIAKAVEKKPEVEKEEKPAEPPVINVTVPITVERSAGNKTVKMVKGKDGQYTMDVKESK